MKQFVKTTIRLHAVLLVIAILLSSMYLTAYATDLTTSSETQVISTTLESMMRDIPNTTHRVMIWLSDIETDEAIAT